MPKSPTQLAREAVFGKTSTRIRATTRLRAPAIATYRALARTALVGPPPKVFANSIPKSGTHLLSQLLGGVPHLWFSGVHINHRRFRDDGPEGPGFGPLRTDELARYLRRVRNGQFLTAHFAYLPGVSQVLADGGLVPMLMIRDPRDLVVSSAHYLASREGLPGHEELRAMSDHDRLLAAINGLPTTSRAWQEVPSIGRRLERTAGWLSDPGTLVVRFEDLVGPRGGGSEQAQHDSVRAILAHCRRETSDAAVAALAERTFARHSRTFRKGMIGDWRNHFTPEHEAAFQASAGPYLAAFGYA